jgi:hypothetical protein
MAATTIVISPKGTLASTETYYSVAAEFPTESQPLQDMRRFVLYPWAYNALPNLSGRQLPPA